MEAPGASVVLDASAGIALLRDEPGGERVEDLLRTRHACMSTVNVAEMVDVLVRRLRAEPDQVLARVDELLATVVPVGSSVELSQRAGELRARLFDRRACRLSLADCFALATVEPGGRIATADTVLAEAARSEGVTVVDVSG